MQDLACSHVEMVQEIFAERALAGIAPGREAHARIDTPKIIGDMFAHMADNDLQFRMFVEHAGAAHAERVQRGFPGKIPG